jgi:hypothetical protein
MRLRRPENSFFREGSNTSWSTFVRDDGPVERPGPASLCKHYGRRSGPPNRSPIFTGVPFSLSLKSLLGDEAAPSGRAHRHRSPYMMSSADATPDELCSSDDSDAVRDAQHPRPREVQLPARCRRERADDRSDGFLECPGRRVPRQPCYDPDDLYGTARSARKGQQAAW